MTDLPANPDTYVNSFPALREGERSELNRSAGKLSGPLRFPDPEVSPKAQRRRFSATYKLRLVQAADRCLQIGDIGALLRREGIYSSQLSQWRKLRDSGALAALKGNARRLATKPVNPLQAELETLRQENSQLKKRLKQTELIIEFQKKAAEILGIPLAEDNRSTS